MMPHGAVRDSRVGRRQVLVADAEMELRAVTEGDASWVLEAVRESHAHLAPWMSWAQETYGPEDVQVFLEDVALGVERAYAIVSRADGVRHGICSLNRVDETNRTANLGYWLRGSSTGRGLATRAARAMLVHALEDLRMERVEVSVAVANVASVRVARRLGLREEGVRGRSIRVGDQQHDARVFAAFASDLERVRPG
jgi:ribosomal-protein-serine acetyltransferase